MEVSLINNSKGSESQKEILSLIENCTSCGKCKRVCPFLEKYGLPSEIIKNPSDIVFLCTNCRACDTNCPEELSPSRALHNLKYELIKNNQISEITKSSILSSRSFAMRGHRFPFVYYSKAEIAFWPGCSLNGTRPELVKKITKILNTHYQKNIGLVLDCCFDPAFQNGDMDVVNMAVKRIVKRLESKGIKKLILGCTNCKKIFSLFMPAIETVHILEILPDITEIKKEFINKDLYLHHPCPSFRYENMRQKINSTISQRYKVAGQNTSAMCCGLGGLAHSVSTEMVDAFTDRILKDSKEKTIITYCMGCKNRFLKKDKEAYHVIELFTDDNLIKKPVSSGRKWFNRLLLSLSARLNYKKLFLFLLLFMAIIIVTSLRQKGYISAERLFEFIKTHKVLAPALFILFYSIGPSLFIPSLPLTIGAGFLWGPVWGVIFSITGATIGAFIPFLLSRYFFGDFIKERFGYSRWLWLKEKVERHGWKAVAFARLLPVLPFPVLNYLFGITPIRAIHYLWSTFLFMLPACIAYVVFGSSMEELIFKGNIKGLITGILVVSLIMLLPFIIKPLFKKFGFQNGD